MRININHIIFSVFESSMEEIEFFLDDISKDMLELNYVLSKTSIK